MNQRSLIAIIILAGIGSIGSVLAYSGTISAGQGNFNNVLVTGTCSGCGISEGSFTTYSTLFNNTISGSMGSIIQYVKIFDDKSIINEDSNSNATIINTSQTIVGFSRDQGSYSGPNQSPSSINGEYKLIFNSSTKILEIFKNNVLLQSLTISGTDFSAGTLQTASFAISPDGHYIAIYGVDTAGLLNRLVILQGS